MSSEAIIATLRARRAGNRAAFAVCAFELLFFLSSQVRVVRERSPWADDPYDLVVSIAALVVPVVGVVTFVRFQRWADEAAMPPEAVRLALRGVFVVLMLIWATVATCLVAVIAQAGSVPFALGALGTGVVCLVATREAWLAARAPQRQPGPQRDDDVLDDLREFLRRPGSIRRILPGSVLRASSWVADVLAQWLASPWSPRRRRVLFPLVVATAFGVSISAWHTLAEGTGGPLGGLFVTAGYAITAAAIVLVAYVTVGRYLYLVGPDRRP
jgi:hypothetical protein